MVRAKNIDEKISNSICEILDGWTEALSWELLIEAIHKRLAQAYTRQALHKHERIHQAFSARKELLANGEGKRRIATDPVLQTTFDRVARLEAENKRLKRENTLLLEQFVRWTYNAGVKGLTIDFLNQNLPSVNRGQTDRNRKK